jgi:hypothetical protein
MESGSNAVRFDLDVKGTIHIKLNRDVFSKHDAYVMAKFGNFHGKSDVPRLSNRAKGVTYVELVRIFALSTLSLRFACPDKDAVFPS